MSNSQHLVLHEAFEQFANQTPNAIALKFHETSISYGELNTKSNRIASSLQQKGVKTSDIIPVLYDRSIDVISIFLGILKTGAAYLPIDSKLPDERINLLIHESNANFIICHKNYLPKIKNQSIIIETLESLVHISKETITNFNPPTIPLFSPAVILFTSGTTGIPKGVVLTHDGLSNRIHWGIENYKHQATDVFLQQTTLTFDFSIFEIFTALSSGAKLIISRPELHLEGKYLIQLIQHEKINVIGTVPSVLKLLLQDDDFEKCKSLSFVFLGGEIVTPQLQNAFFKTSNARLINIYGPTEASISVLHWECKQKYSKKIVPIGFPIANMNIHLLNDNFQEIQQGEIGELFISGKGLATKYLNNEQLTREKFVTHSIDTISTRLYRTGDYGRQLEDGSYAFEGRKDKQVKLNGIRVELEEIETVIRRIETIEDCVVLPTSNQTVEVKLTAYIISKNNLIIDIRQLKKELSNKLSSTLIPGFFIQIEKFPLLSTGKIDKNALPIPDKIRELTQQSFVAPQTITQKQLVEIWEKVLKLHPIGVLDPFDSLGGDSLQRLEIYHWIQKKMNFQYPISYFIQSNTIFEQAQIIDEPIQYNKKLQVTQLRTGHLTPIIILQAIQSEGSIFGKRFEENLPPFHSVYATIPFGIQENQVPDTIEQCAEIYVDSLLSICDEQKFILGGFSMGGIVAIEIAKQLQKKGKTISFIFILDTLFPSIDISPQIKSQEIKEIIEFYFYKLKYGDLTFWKTWVINRIKWLPKKVLRASKLKGNKMINNKNISLVSNYHFDLFQGKIIYFVAQSDRRNQISWGFFNRTSSEENLSLWRKAIKGNFIVLTLIGHHLSLVEEKKIAQICQLLTPHLQDS